MPRHAAALSIGGALALVAPSTLSAALRRVPRAHGAAAIVDCLPAWVQYAIQRQLPRRVATLAWCQLAFSAFALIGRAQHFSHTWFDHACYTASNVARLFASCACISVGVARTQKLQAGQPVVPWVRALSPRLRLCGLGGLAAGAVGVTLPFALWPSNEREVLPTQARRP